MRTAPILFLSLFTLALAHAGTTRDPLTGFLHDAFGEFRETFDRVRAGAAMLDNPAEAPLRIGEPVELTWE
jgi:hypothetical protein